MSNTKYWKKLFLSVFFTVMIFLSVFGIAGSITILASKADSSDATIINDGDAATGAQQPAKMSDSDRGLPIIMYYDGGLKLSGSQQL
jgi:hypothetical protein